MLTIKPATVTYEGVEYQIELGAIESTHIGPEDHGIFSINVDFAFESAGQGTGHYNPGNGNVLRAFIEAFLRIARARKWEQLVGKRVYVLRSEPGFGRIEGIMNLEQTEVVILKDLFNYEDD